MPDSSSVAPAFGAVSLLLVDATKAMDSAPAGIGIGLIVLRSWQVHRLPSLPADFSAHVGYLVRVNYEFDIAPDVPAPTWAEVGFGFPDDVTVVDVVPRGVARPQSAQSYVVDQHLNFAVGNGAAADSAPTAAMPPILPRIDTFGPGGPSVRWRHTGSDTETVPVGSQVGWMVLLTSPDRESLKVVASGGYRLDLDPDLGLAPASLSDAFTISLPDAGAPMVAATPGSTTSGSIRVFVSYSQESASHRESVRRLVGLLRVEGFDVRFDQDALDERRNWADWTNAQIERCDYVLVIASPTYRLAAENNLPSGSGLGVRSEYNRLVDLLHRDESRWTKKILPVVLPGRAVEEIPLIFLPGTVSHFIVEDFTPDGARDLLRVFQRRSGD
ncbi:toll/interleukin-1 receptor domain-containing protein [Streptomyces sp. NPDC126522]|uniref:toll/interleukin-1 receptor domain-containing protein n=1 Tax=Streptomyces sp. NPDC126522 TaxID=3155211 RepID=UPI00332D38F4